MRTSVKIFPVNAILLAGSMLIRRLFFPISLTRNASKNISEASFWTSPDLVDS